MKTSFRTFTAAALLALPVALVPLGVQAQQVDSATSPDLERHPWQRRQQGAHARQVDSATLAAAQALHDEAVAALDAKDYAKACPKLERVVQMIPQGLGARMTLAECYERAGKLASAWAAYVAVEYAASKVGQRERQQAAGRKAAALRPKLAELTVVVPEAVKVLPGLEIRRGLASIKPAEWGVPIPVDAGSHRLVVTAPGKPRWETSIQVDADGASASVAVPALEDELTATPSSPGEAPESTPGSGEGGTPSGAQRVAGLVVGGVGVVGIGVGAFFGLRALSKRNASNADGHCHDGNECDEVGFALREEGHAAGTVSTVMFVVGGVALAGGVTLFLTAPRGEGGAGAVVAVGPQGIALRGRW